MTKVRSVLLLLFASPKCEDKLTENVHAQAIIAISAVCIKNDLSQCFCLCQLFS